MEALRMLLETPGGWAVTRNVLLDMGDRLALCEI